MPSEEKDKSPKNSSETGGKKGMLVYKSTYIYIWSTNNNIPYRSTKPIG